MKGLRSTVIVVYVNGMYAYAAGYAAVVEAAHANGANQRGGSQLKLLPVILACC
jgi:hypothetical protein